MAIISHVRLLRTYTMATVQTLPRGRYKAVSVNTNFVASGFSVFLFTLDKKTEAWLLGPLKKGHVFSNFVNKILHLFSARFIFTNRSKYIFTVFSYLLECQYYHTEAGKLSADF